MSNYNCGAFMFKDAPVFVFYNVGKKFHFFMV